MLWEGDNQLTIVCCEQGLTFEGTTGCNLYPPFTQEASELHHSPCCASPTVEWLLKCCVRPCLVAGVWNDRGWSSACHVFGICKDAIPSEIRLMWNSGAQFWGEDCGQWHWPFFDLQPAWRDLYPWTSNHERSISNLIWQLMLSFFGGRRWRMWLFVKNKMKEVLFDCVIAPEQKPEYKHC